MITDSNEFARCGDGWALWDAWATSVDNDGDIMELSALRAYRRHVKDCPVCRAQEGRFNMTLDECIDD